MFRKLLYLQPIEKGKDEVEHTLEHTFVKTGKLVVKTAMDFRKCMSANLKHIGRFSLQIVDSQELGA